MSQSDYLEHKKRAVELKMQTDLPPILTPSDYTAFKQFALEKNVLNTTPTYNQLVPINTKMIFDINLSNNHCPTFIVDHNTQNRPNRVLVKGAYSVPVPVPLYVKHPKMVCANCCTDTTMSKTKNNANTLFSLCRQKRLLNTLCNCAELV